MNKHFDLETVKYQDRELFENWHDRFANEYNRSRQHRQGHILNLGTPQSLWDIAFKHEVPPLWIKFGHRNIGFVSPQSIKIGRDKDVSQTVQIISDVYIDPKFRRRGLLAACLLEQRNHGRQVILIDREKLLDNCAYYQMLGFRYACHWHEQELLLVSPEAIVDKDIWTQIIPDNVDLVI